MRKLWNIVCVLFRVLLFLSLLGGLRTYYHFFWAPTGIAWKNTGKPVFRYQLLDVVLGKELNQKPPVSE